jgi:hypothetical protein
VIGGGQGAGRKSEAGRQPTLLNRCHGSEREGEGVWHGWRHMEESGEGSGMGAVHCEGGAQRSRNPGVTRAWSRVERGREAGRWVIQWGGA